MRFLLHHLLERSAATAPASTAVVDGERSISYEALDARANQVARALHDAGCVPGDRVGLYLDKSLEAIVGIYGILKAGAAYVPLDPNAPTARLAYIARNAELSCLVTAAAKQQHWNELMELGAPLHTLVVLDAAADELIADAAHGLRLVDREAVEAQPDTPPVTPSVDLDLAYVLYTSGSTGEPKGVMLTHRNALAFVDWAIAEYGIGDDDRLSSHAPLHFDLSVFDLFAAAGAGAAVVLVPPTASLFPVEIARFIEREAITVWYSVPSILSMLTLRGGLEPGRLPALRWVLFAGEVFPTKYLRQLMLQLPDVRFANLYGPTETNVCTAYEVVTPPGEGADPVPIGVPVANDMVYVVTEDGRLADPGETGELYVRGATVMRGYWGDPDRTARGLVPDPFGPLGDPVYRTGDLVCSDPDGNLRYVGRRDSQIKSRGYRIELGDIEAALNGHPAVLECAVVAVPDELVTNRIAAYVATRNGTGEQDLAAFCGTRIPRYMIPERIELLDGLPRTSTGKIDRHALATMARTAAESRP